MSTNTERLLDCIPAREMKALAALWYADPYEAYWKRLEIVLNNYCYRYEDTPGWDNRRKPQ